MKLRFSCLLATTLSAAIQSVMPAAPRDDIAVVKQRLAANYVAESKAETVAMNVSVPESPEALLAKLGSDGAWPDIDYHEPITAHQVGFKAFPHVARLRKLSVAYATAHGQDRDVLAAAIHRGLGFWLKTAPDTGHLWYREIGAPLELGRAAILFDDDLTPGERAGVVRILQTCRHADGTLFYSGSPATGENLIWEASLQIMAGCLLQNPDYVATYKNRAEEEMQPTRAEGVQPDWSFHQHGPLLSSGASYGMSFVSDCAKLAVAFRGTTFALSNATVDLLVHCVLDGQQWMTRGRSWDYSAIGRNIVWPHVDPAQIAPACDQLADVAPDRARELHTFARRIRGEDPAAAAPVGNRLYWNSDYMTQLRPGYFASARMSSRRVFGNESGNGQGEKTNYHLGDGAFCLMLTGDEYRSIFPVWNWRHVPGITCVDPWPSSPLPANVWGIGSEGGSNFAGGVSDGRCGAAAMELDRAGVKARKGWFFLDDAIVCLGSSIQALDPNAPVITSINQCWARGDIRIGPEGAGPAEGSTLALRDPAWIQHDHVAYLFPRGGDIRVAREFRTGTWQDINATTRETATPSGDVFSLWIEHGRGHRDASYAYVVVPNIGPSDVEAYRRSAAPDILANGPNVQAVTSADGRVIEAVFWHSGRLEVPNGPVIAVDDPSAILMCRDAGDRWTISAGDPNQKLKALRIRVSYPRSSAAPQELLLPLPQGEAAGRSQTQALP